MPPHTSAALAYDAANLLFQAMGEAGTTDTAVVKTKLAAISFQGVSGTLFYDQSHNAVKSAVVMRVQTDGVHFLRSSPRTSRQRTSPSTTTTAVRAAPSPSRAPIFRRTVREPSRSTGMSSGPSRSMALAGSSSS